jgi:hypothetical protein
MMKKTIQFNLFNGLLILGILSCNTNDRNNAVKPNNSGQSTIDGVDNRPSYHNPDSVSGKPNLIHENALDTTQSEQDHTYAEPNK